MDTALKAKIRAELFRCAVAGDLPTYTEFFNRIHPGKQMAIFPTRPISTRSRKRSATSDIRKGCEWISESIDFRDARKGPDDDQLSSLRAGTYRLIELYCPPDTPNPY